MRKVFSTTVTFMVISASAALAEGTVTNVQPVAPVLSGEVELNFTQNATTDKWGGAMALDLDVNASGLATIDLDFSATDGNALTLDNWTVGTTVNNIGLAIGDDNGVMPDAEGNHTLTAPVMTESVKVTAGAASVALGFTDWTTDVTDISNVQGAYTVDAGVANVTGALDYNLDSENTVIGGGVSDFAFGGAVLGGAMSYDMDASKFAYEGTVGMAGLTAYTNGDQDDALQNVGGEYTMMLGGAELEGGINYNIDNEEFTPSLSVGFSF